MKTPKGNSLKFFPTYGFCCAIFTLFLSACGNSTGNDSVTNHNNAGTGTSTLLVTVDINANDDKAVIGGFNTDYTVTVRDGSGNPVSGAIVTIQNSSIGSNALPERAVLKGVYSLSGSTYPAGDFRLDVVRGTDNIQGVILGGPMAHSILAPLENDTIRADSVFTVRWSVPIQAKSAEVETKDLKVIAMADQGFYQISAVDNPNRDKQRLRIFRFNELNIAGGLPGSIMRIKVRQTVEPYVVR